VAGGPPPGGGAAAGGPRGGDSEGRGVGPTSFAECMGVLTYLKCRTRSFLGFE
jgi:hypothetical protein